jgi:acetyl esterase/lipase
MNYNSSTFRKTVVSLALPGLLTLLLIACGDATNTAIPPTTTAAATVTALTNTPQATTTSTTRAVTTSQTTVASTTAAATGSNDPLQFPVNNFTEATTTVTTSSGTKQVTYRLYQSITYVAKPVDAKYQSLNVKVPVKVDGKSVDATNAPILLANSIGGYISSTAGGSGMRGAPGGGVGTGSGANSSSVSRNTDLALAAGYVVVEPGARGRDNQASDGTYYGKAPAAIVDLKSAVRYIRHNKGIIPGNTDWIISTGVSAGGALSALLGASGNSPLYENYFKEIGAADADDSIFASADFCPITDLEHADMAYEWMFGTIAINGKQVDQTISQQLKDAFATYQASLKLQGQNSFGTLTADNYGKYLVQTYLIPSANKYLSALTEEKRKEYLAANSWITWSNNTASFTFEDYVKHIGRMKSLPAFDAFEMTTAENILFGNKTTNSRHFTTFSLQQASGNKSAELDSDLKTLVNLMNPMYFIAQNNSGVAKYWWIRHGSSDKDTSLPIIVNLATMLENNGKEVHTLLYWDAGHGADQDPEAFIAWIGKITGFTKS